MACLPLFVYLKLIPYLPYLLFVILRNFFLWLVPRSFRTEKDVKGQTVLITGAGSGIGRLLAIEFAKRDSRLVLLDLNRGPLLETEKLLKPNTATFLYECDVSDRRRVYEVADVVRREFGRVDILVNNAGIVSGKRFMDIPDEKIVKTMEVNALAHFWTCKAFLPDMIQFNHGHVVSVASMAGWEGVAGLTDYCASKHAAVGFMKTLKYELLARKLTGVKLTTICPTVISTGLFEGMTPPFDVLLKPEDVAKEIMNAVLLEEEMVFLPRWLENLHLLTLTVPTEVTDAFYLDTGVATSMDAFKGREPAN